MTVPERGARRPGLRQVFSRPAYRRLWAARTVSQWGDSFSTVALALLVYEVTGSGLGVTAVVAAEILPVLLLAPLAGALVDRLSRVRVMVSADLARAAAVTVLALGHDHVAVVYAVAFLTSVGAVFFNPASGSLLPALVREDELVAANSGMWVTAVLSQVALAPLAGFVVTTAGFGAAFAVNAASYVVSALLLRRLPVPAPPAAVPRRRLFSEAAEGARLLVREPLLRALAVAQLPAALSAGATSALLVVYAEERLQVTGPGYGALLAAIGVGAALGPLVLLRLVREPRRPLLVFGPFALAGSSTSSWPRPRACPWPPPRSSSTGWAPRRGASPSPPCCSPRPRSASGGGCSRRWTCCGRRAASSRWGSAASSPTWSTSGRSTSSVDCCSSSPPATGRR